ncbi:hypothetical protein WR25_11499 [Diploscapter pachys]|uniref:Uncharacterized protein n=1 Tax=Diploscapter pachys TaxID=2018661 RepID=A0A2A2L7A4_9BILA|nr:hypothetical protein WR25_11499 [Diploscapter pachys]
MAPYSILITGANRGIGLALVREFLKDENIQTIIAGARNPEAAEDLKSIKDDRLRIIKLDISSDESIDRAVEEIKHIVNDKGLTVLVNNAGVHVHMVTKQRVTREQLMEQFQSNVFGTIILTQALLPLLQQASSLQQNDDFSIDRAAIINISSNGASLERNNTNLFWGGSNFFKFLGYRASKSALNQVMRTMAVDLLEDKILSVSFCPGGCRTEMTRRVGVEAELSPEESAEALIKSFNKLDKTHNAGFYNRNLEVIPF